MFIIGAYDFFFKSLSGEGTINIYVRFFDLTYWTPNLVTSRSEIIIHLSVFFSWYVGGVPNKIKGIS